MEFAPRAAPPYSRLEELPAGGPGPGPVSVPGPVPSYKYWSIFNILCCCLPLGLVAVFYSGQVEECLARRDTAGAKSASDTARTINILALVIGLACIGVAIFYLIQRMELIKFSTAPTTQSPLYYNLG
ncbi:dispanin subfamily A member 2b-like [Emydura macquarii macquarii]|uniref:dispanin subfamily A member 2b-like n=1 Tax=Emydura macquarii macquarii TaxID=1129001 RepID=UPI00352A1B9F